MNRRLCLLHPKNEEQLQKLNFGSCYYGCDLTALAILYNDSPESVAYSALIDDSKPTVKIYKTKRKPNISNISSRILINKMQLILNIQ
jgi:hypothetical protein